MQRTPAHTTREIGQPGRCSRHRRGITLIESVMSLAVVSILLMGLSSSVMLGARAIPTQTEMGVADRGIQQLLGMIREDLGECSEVLYQKSGNTIRLTLTMIPTGATGAHSYVLWEFIGDFDAIRRRVNSDVYQIMTQDMTSYRLSAEQEGGHLRSVHMQFHFEDSIQQYFELHVQTPYAPEVK